MRNILLAAIDGILEMRELWTLNIESASSTRKVLLDLHKETFDSDEGEYEIPLAIHNDRDYHDACTDCVLTRQNATKLIESRQLSSQMSL